MIRPGVTWLQLDGPLVSFQHPFFPSEGPVNITQTIPGAGIIRVEANGLLVSFDGFFVMALGVVDIAQAVIGDSLAARVRLIFNRLLIQLQSLPRLAQSLINGGPVMISPGVAGVEF